MSSKAPSTMTRWRVTGISSGKMAACMRVSGKLVRRMAKENSTGLMASSMMESSKIMSVMGLASCTIHAGRNSRELGGTERRTGDASIPGPMALGTR